MAWHGSDGSVRGAAAPAPKHLQLPIQGWGVLGRADVDCAPQQSSDLWMLSCRWRYAACLPGAACLPHKVCRSSRPFSGSVTHSCFCSLNHFHWLTALPVLLRSPAKLLFHFPPLRHSELASNIANCIIAWPSSKLICVCLYITDMTGITKRVHLRRKIAAGYCWPAVPV